MKKVNKALSLCMVMVLLLTSLAFSSSAKTIYDDAWFSLTYEDFLEYGHNSGVFEEEDLCFETLNGVDYIYIVDNGEATILNVRTNYIGPNETVYVFPTHLGGYPVTTLGDIKYGNIGVFAYMKLPDEEWPANPSGNYDVDPGLYYVSAIVIPEGYKYIGEYAFMYFDTTFYLPDSLEYLGDYVFEMDSVIVYKPWTDLILPVSGVKEIKPATDAPYFAYGNRDYKLELTGSPSKIQLVRENGTTTTIDRSKATITSNGETETWVVNMRVGEGEHAVRAKYGKVWVEKYAPLSVTYDTPKAHSFDITYENGIGTFEVVTDPQIAKVQFLLDSGSTLTYSQSYSRIAEDGMRHWTVTRKIPADTNYTLKTKLGYTWTTTDLKVTS
ncbi:MAG: hypothetical protein UHK54_08405 [Acutalibacteraceae bacterium]|nr:hypothetical protein [Acutalibacteraceae bacterium]